MRKRLILLFVFMAGLFSFSQAQELNCNVSVASQQVQMSNKNIFKSMENSIREFMNTRKWTSDAYDLPERIECNIVFTISAVQGNSYSGNLQVKASRPVFSTGYYATTFYLIDKQITFDFVDNMALNFQDGAYTSELTSLLAYYAYMILAYDYDSFSELGGTQYFQKAFDIANAAQASSSKGWSSMEKNDRNRYYVANDILDNRYKDIRKAYYQYHRKGLDFMYENKEKGLTNIVESLKMIQKSTQMQVNITPIILFFDAKSSEIIDLFAQAPSGLKANARDLASKLDPANAGKYTSGIR